MLKLPLCGNKWTKTIEKKREIQNSDGINRPHSQTLAPNGKSLLGPEFWMQKVLKTFSGLRPDLALWQIGV